MRKNTFLYWLPVLCVAALIFYFSSRTGTQSNAQSDPFVEALNTIFRTGTLLPVVRIVRKSGHIIEFAALGFTSLFAFYSTKIKYPVVSALLLSYVYALTDELHQFFVSGRSASFQDTLIDLIGIGIGIGIYQLIKSIKKSGS